MDKETQEIVNEIKGLDSIGRPILKYAVKELYDIEKLPDEVGETVDALDEIVNDEAKLASLLKLIRVFSKPSNKSDIVNGYGTDIWFDNQGRVNMEVDFLRVRNKSVDKHSQLQSMSGENGTTITSSSAKIKSLNRRTS